MNASRIGLSSPLLIQDAYLIVTGVVSSEAFAVSVADADSVAASLDEGDAAGFSSFLEAHALTIKLNNRTTDTSTLDAFLPTCLPPK